jgi:hypothetical protein
LANSIRGTALYADLTGADAEPAGLHTAGLRLRRIAATTLDAYASEPAALRQELLREFPERDDVPLLLIACDSRELHRSAQIDDWMTCLHQPLARCFTAISGLFPLVQRAATGGHALVLLPGESLIPDPLRGPASVLGRGVLGLFEGLRAELRKTAARATVFLLHERERADEMGRRLADALISRPLYSMPKQLPPEAIESYFGPLKASLRATPAGKPLPAGPMGEVYHDALGDAAHG